MTGPTTPDAISQVDPTEAVRLAESGALLFDVREPPEWTAGHIPGAVHIPLGTLDPAAAPTDRAGVAVCRSGWAATTLAAAGIDARNLSGGMQVWALDGRGVTRNDGSLGTVA